MANGFQFPYLTLIAVAATATMNATSALAVEHPDCVGNRGIAQIVGRTLEARHFGRECRARIEYRHMLQHGYCPLPFEPTAADWVVILQPEECPSEDYSVSGILRLDKNDRLTLSDK
jgi:hypothetical protein